MRYLLDEDVSPSLVPVMSTLFRDDTFQHIVEVTGAPGTDDGDIPPLCQAEGFNALITMNVRDFGVRRHYYASLGAHRVHVVVMSPGRVQPDAP